MGVLDKVFGGGAGKLVESVGGVLDNLTTTKDEKLEESEGPDTKEETSSEISDIKLSGLMGTKIGMTQTIMEDGQIIPTTVVQLGPCLALEKKLAILCKKTALTPG